MGKDDRHRAIAKLLRNSAKHPMQTAAHILQPQIEPLVNKAGITDTEVEASERFPRCLLITDPILPDEIKEYTVQAVAFTITSHDQGWASEDNYEGNYEHSLTWFEVCILRPVPDGVNISPRKKNSIESEPCIKDYLDKKYISNQLHFVIGSSGPFWHLQRNRRGHDQPTEHKVRWNRVCELSESERRGRGYNLKNGSGSGVGFVPSLEAGDRVAIIARAKESESVNYISEAKIEVFFKGLDPVHKGVKPML